MAVSLPDDVVLEILLHVKDIPAALFRCAMACRRWRGLVADLSFLRRCWPQNSFVGFMARERLDGKGEGTKGFIPAPGSALGHGFRALTSFVPALPAEAAPLVSRHGLLLVRLNSDDPTITTRLAVCNLHLGTCHVLPPLTSRDLVYYNLEVNCYAVLSAADCHSDDHDDKPPPPLRGHPSSFFKVVIIGYHRGDNRYHLHTLSSHETRWRVRVDCFALDYAGFGFFSNVVVRHGTAHWIFGNGLNSRYYAANLNTQTEHISLTKLCSTLSPVSTRYCDTSRQCLTLAEDGEALLLLRMNETEICPLIEVWGQQLGEQQNVDGTSEWFRSQMIELKQPGMERGLCLLGEKCGTLLVSDNRRRVYTADLETGTMERVVDWPRGCYMKPGEIVPLEMDWAAVFVSRLRTRKSRYPLLVLVRCETAPKRRVSRKCRRRRQEVMAPSQRR